MPSPKLNVGRYSRAGEIYAVTVVTGGREPVFRNENYAAHAIVAIRDCELSRLSDSLAWVVMPEHVHWMFALRLGTLGACVQRFKSVSTRAINACRSGAESVWQRGYYDHRLRSDEDLLAQARYIVANPIRRGLARRIEDYPYWWARHIHSSADL
ncbi:MAG TPA: transposase [Luteimonas sp.]|nr:transposase [Luteimonas sp.]